MSYLTQFPIDVLKIDQSFVQAIGFTKGTDIIVSAVIAMGNSLKQRVIAEGVENQMQLAFLKAQHCEEGQGYFFGRPLVAEQFAALLATGISIPMWPCSSGFANRNWRRHQASPRREP